MTGPHPWERNAGRYDTPSSGVPQPEPPPPSDEELELARYRGVEPIGERELEAEPEVVEAAAADTPSHTLLRAFVQRLERLAAEITDLQADRRDVMSEAVCAGFDRKALNELLRRRKLDPRTLAELDDVVAIYEEVTRGMTRGEIWGGDLKPRPLTALPAPAPRNDRERRALAAVAASEAVRRVEEA